MRQTFYIAFLRGLFRVHWSDWSLHTVCLAGAPWLLKLLALWWAPAAAAHTELCQGQFGSLKVPVLVSLNSAWFSSRSLSRPFLGKREWLGFVISRGPRPLLRDFCVLFVLPSLLFPLPCHLSLGYLVWISDFRGAQT